MVGEVERESERAKRRLDVEVEKLLFECGTLKQNFEKLAFNLQILLNDP